MQILILVPRFTLIFLRYLFVPDLSFTFYGFDTAAFLVISIPPTHSSFDNDERHVRAFQPITEASHSRSYDTV